MKKILLLAIFFASSWSKAEVYAVPHSSVFSPQALAITALMHSKKGFSVVQNGASYPVQKHNLDKRLRAISLEQLKAFVDNGYIAVKQSDIGEFSLDAKVRGLGGGPYAAVQAYWLTKSALYAGLGIAVGGTIVATGGAVVAAGSAVAAGTATASTVIVAAGAGVGGATVATVATGSTVGGVLVGAATTTGAIVAGAEGAILAGATATGAMSVATASGALGATTATSIGATGVAAATAAGIEAVAMAAFSAALVCPWTPW
jgi:hypothetical protein